MIEPFEVYINAQKTIANYMLAFGLIMLLLAVLIHFSASNTLFFGFKTGLLLFGLFSSIGGYAYKITEEKLLNDQRLLYQENPTEFHQKEKERMAKVVKNFPFIQMVFVTLILISLVINLLVDKALVNGILFSLVIFFVGNLIIESVSKKSIDTYFEKLSNS